MHPPPPPPPPLPNPNFPALPAPMYFRRSSTGSQFATAPITTATTTPKRDISLHLNQLPPCLERRLSQGDIFTDEISHSGGWKSGYNSSPPKKLLQHDDSAIGISSTSLTSTTTATITPCPSKLELDAMAFLSRPPLSNLLTESIITITPFSFVLSGNLNDKPVYIKCINRNTEEYSSIGRLINPMNTELNLMIKGTAVHLPEYISHEFINDYLVIITKTHGRRKRGGYHDVEWLYYFSSCC